MQAYLITGPWEVQVSNNEIPVKLQVYLITGPGDREAQENDQSTYSTSNREFSCCNKVWPKTSPSERAGILERT